MKFNHNQNQRSFTLAALLSIFAIATSVSTTAIKPVSKAEAELPNIEQQDQIEEKPKQFEPDNKGNDEAWEEVELDQEWKSILENESGDEEIIARTPGM